MGLGHKRVPSLHRCEAGAAAVEFAIIAMVMILVCVGMIEFGRGLYIYNQIAYAADKGARVILINNTAADTDVEIAIRDAFGAGNSELIEITPGVVGTEFRTIEIIYSFNLLIPSLGGDSISLRLNRQIPLTPLT